MPDTFDPIYEDYELLHPSAALLETCDLNFIIASRAFAYRLKDDVQFEKAAQVFERLIPVQRKIYGEEDVQHMRSIFDLASMRQFQDRNEEALALLHPLLALRERVLGPEHQHTLNTMNAIADCYVEQGNLGEAQAMLETSLAAQEQRLGSEHVSVCLTLNSLGLVYKCQGALDLAGDVFLKAITALEKHVDDEDRDLLLFLTNLASVYSKLGDDAQEEFIRHRILLGWIDGWGGWGSEHPYTLSAMEKMAVFLEKRERHKDARDLWKSISDARMQDLGPRHTLTLDSQLRLSRALHALEDNQRARVVAETVVQGRMKNLGQSSSLLNLSKLWQFLDDRLWLGICYCECGQWRKAEALFQEVISTSHDLQNENPRFFLLLQSNSYYWMGSLRREQERWEEARVYRRQALDCCEKLPEPINEQSVMCMTGLTDILINLEGSDDPEPMINEAIELSEATHGSNTWQTISLVKNLAMCYMPQQRYTEAKPLLDRVITYRERKWGPCFVGNLVPMHMAAICADKFKQYDEAESLLKRAIEGYTRSEGLQSESTIMCMEHLLELLHYQGKSDELEAQREEWAAEGVRFKPHRVGQDEGEDWDNSESLDPSFLAFSPTLRKHTMNRFHRWSTSSTHQYHV